MNINCRSIYLATYVLGFLSNSAFAHDPPVHRAITVNAAAAAYTNSLAYSNFVDMVSSDLPTAQATNYMVIGSDLEDNTMPPSDVGGYRSVNHFYDPLDNTYGKGLSDSPPDRRVRIGTNSFAWGSVSNCLGYNYYGFFDVPWFGKNVNTSNT